MAQRQHILVLSYPRARGGGGGKYTLVVILLATTLSIIWAQFQLEELYGDVQVSPAPERTPIDFGRIVDGYPLTDLRACVPSGLAPVSLFTSILGGWDETYYIAPGGSFERSGLRRSYWQIRGQGFSQNPSRFYLVGRTLFELRYRNKLPEASHEILRDFYGWNQQPYPVQMNYLSFLIQRSHARLALNQGNWTVSVDMQTRLCHDDQNASLGEGCSGVVGNQNCADILGQLLINRTSSNPGANCSSGACYWFDPVSRFGDVYHRSWRAGTVSLNFDRENNNGGNNRRLATVRTSPSGASVECNRIQLTPDNDNMVRLFASSETYKGLIIMRRRAFPDGTRSLDPLGIPELGENELVFRETPSGVQLKTALSAWMLADPPESFLLRIPLGGGELVLADQVEWFSNRLFWRTPNVPFQFSWNRYGYVPSITQRTVQAEGETVSLGKIFIWNFAEYNAQRLPDYNPAINTNVFGKQVAEMLFRPASNAPLTVVGRANYEVFFPAVGTRHPSDVRDVYTGNRAPNWFYYYMRVASHFWRQIGEVAGASLSGDPAIVFFSTYNPYAPYDTGAYYDPSADRVFIRDSSINYQERTLKLFKMGVGLCNGQPVVQIVSADQLQVRGIHAFLSVLYHELGHRWLHTNSFVSCQTGAIFPIMSSQHPSNLDRDRDNDGLDDEWEEMNGLCPYDKDTTGAFSSDPVYAQIGGDREVVAEIYAYRYLMATESSTQPRLWLWRHDWSDKGLQFGNPVERFSAFPWKYESTGGRFPRDTGLLTSLPRPLGCNR